MTENPDHTRRWLINVSGAALLSNVLPVAPASAQGAGAAKPAAAAPAAEGGGKAEPLSPVTVALAGYISGALDRELPAAVVPKTKMHVLDTIAAMFRLPPQARRSAARMSRRSAGSRRRP